MKNNENLVSKEIALLMAVQCNDLNKATELIKQGADVNRRGPTPYTLLMIAAGFGNVQMTDILLAAGADVFAMDSTLGASALHKAAQSGVTDVAKLILDKGAFINLQSATVGHTPVIDAIWAKKPGMVKFLLERGAAIDIKTHYGGTVWDFVGNEVNWTAGSTIPEKESWGKTIRELLEKQEKKNAEILDKQQLMKAVAANDLKAVEQLIAKGANVNEQSPVLGSGNDGQTPLLVACFNGFTEIVEKLINAGANPKIVDYLLKATPLHKAAFAGHPESMKLVLSQGLVEVNAQGPYNGYTAMHDCVWHGHEECLKVLLETDARTDLKGFDGNTPYSLAVALGYSKLAELIKAKTDQK
ncbi:MAG: ankyrin repeat domain-containing protein [Bacteroidales bacterium]|nr:ankyrin repeat domain-containing protein [Bacteroidales bacterium]MCF8454301.1 ankyrin repeat domain-containing protein [Bacteroidales bacterium]